ncbi:hypothetical protein QUA27_22200 [Microcoleus sp. Pol14C6]|uniref:hypothetical protein n=1 Tax=unclassified Microcoleus TaxID=2642155 RepID=UPI002FCEBE4C
MQQLPISLHQSPAFSPFHEPIIAQRVALSNGLQGIATTSCRYNAFFRRTFPVQNKRILPLTEVPEVRSRLS